MRRLTNDDFNIITRKTIIIQKHLCLTPTASCNYLAFNKSRAFYILTVSYLQVINTFTDEVESKRTLLLINHQIVLFLITAAI
jgi:hypothetical protein